MIDWERPEWWADSKCRGSQPALFYPEKGEGEDATAVARAAKAVCNGLDGYSPCPVRSECLEYAITNHEKFGVWGGRTERERNSLKRMRKKVTTMPRVVRQVAKTSALRRLLDTSKTETRVLGPVQRHLMVRSPEDRRSDVIHPSEMCKSDWCPRATYYRVAGFAAAAVEPHAFNLENVFAEGSAIHVKWQTWLWEMDLLRGQYRCNACKAEWPSISPTSCPLCKADRSCLEYREVPMFSEEYGIGGLSDGDIADDVVEGLCPLLEIKSVGVGTLRFEAPTLLARHTRKVMDDDDGTERSVVDLEGVWRDIKRPFPTHLKQGFIYLAVTGRKTMVFIYECKWNQQVKEFRVRLQPEVVADLFESCLDIKYALTTGKAPVRPLWASGGHATCGKCAYQQICWAGDKLENDGDEEPISADGRESGCSKGGGGTLRVAVSGASGLRDTKAADQDH